MMLIISIILICFIQSSVFSINYNVDNQIPIWPLPVSLNMKTSYLQNRTITLDQSFHFNSNENYGDVVNKAIIRYQELIQIPNEAIGILTSCDLNINNYQPNHSNAKEKIIGSDESYILAIDSNGECSITSNTIWGILHGLESFTHFLIRNGENIIEVVGIDIDINDKPRFGHRGMLIDTARHYLSIEIIEKVIDSLVINKFNVLHWHAVDAESFPLQTPSEPTMTNSAFSPIMIYTMDQVTALSLYAYNRGIEIIFEIDVPGHAAGWTKGKPEIMSKCFQKYSYNINDFALNPTLDETYSTLQGILSDLSNAVNGASYLHLGGDEVIYGCWGEDESITNFMALNNIPDYNSLLNYFVQRADEIVLKLNSIAIHWEEVFSANCNVSYTNIFEVWTDSTMVGKITSAGYKVIAAPSNYWYLNTGSNTWTRIYSYNPTMDLTTDTQRNLVIGGELALWGEYVDDYNIIPSLYPRASAGAERLWSTVDTIDQDEAVKRLFIQRCRMVNRGYNIGPVQPNGYCDLVYV